MYFNWSVLVPPDSSTPCPVELYFHAPGYSYARPPVKFLDRSIQICPHDFPFSGWYGYTDAVGTLKNPADAAVQPYTVRRIEAFLKWAQGKFPIDAGRIVAVGGDGAAIMALNRPKLFAYVLQATRHPLHAHWAWGSNLTAPGKYSGLWQGLDIQNTTPVPAITNSSADKEGDERLPVLRRPLAGGPK